MLTFLISRLSSTLRTRTTLGFLRHDAPRISYPFSSFGKSSQSNQSEQNPEGNQSFAVSYLRNSCGMSAEAACQVSKRIELNDPRKPNSVLKFLRSYGFSDPQISRILRKHPKLLFTKPEVTILPKLRFMQSIGLLASEIPEVFYLYCSRSLEKCIIPHYKALKSVLDDDDLKARKCLKAFNWRHFHGYDVTNLGPNIKVLRDEGASQNSVFYLLSRSANLAFMSQSKFREHVKFVKETGIESVNSMFADALIVVSQLNKSHWELKLDTFEKFGWSRDVTLWAFSRDPRIMALSEKNISDTMQFFIEKMGLPLEDIARCPSILRYSLKNRIAPRWSVVSFLKKKGLIKKDIPLISIIVMTEGKFLEDFVFKFKENVPRLLELYRGEFGPLPEALK